jgi:importin subunit alpha-6/7
MSTDTTNAPAAGDAGAVSGDGVGGGSGAAVVAGVGAGDEGEQGSTSPLQTSTNTDVIDDFDIPDELTPQSTNTLPGSITDEDTYYRLSSREQAIWALGNIAGNSTRCRDAVIAAGTIDIIVHMLDALGPRALSQAAAGLVRNAAWLLSNLCRGRSPPNWSLIKKAVPQLAFLLSSNDEQIALDACWAISYLSDGDSHHVQAVVEAGVTPRLLQLMKNIHSEVHTPALRAVGNLITLNDNQSEYVTEQPEVIDALHTLLISHERSSRKEAAWTLSNISAGSEAQLQMVINAGVIPTIISMILSPELDIDVRRECVWVLSNAMATARTSSTMDQVMYLLEQNALRTFIEAMDNDDIKVSK